MSERVQTVTDVFDGQGQYSAGKVAQVLGWPIEYIARYLAEDASALMESGASLKHQDQLHKLKTTFDRLLDLMDVDVEAARAWLHTPLVVLDDASPTEVILRGDLPTVGRLLLEIESGFSV